MENNKNKEIIGIIQEGTTELRKDSFSAYTELTSIFIPDSVTKIEECVFSRCKRLVSIVVSKDNKVFDSRDNCNAIIETKSNTLIAGCKNTIIPDSVTEIGWYSFLGCTGLTNIKIPDSVTELGMFSFAFCTGLNSIVIPDSVTEIGVKSFLGCTGLTSIVIGKSTNIINDHVFSNCTNLASIIVSEDNKVFDSRENCNAIIETESNSLIIGCKNTTIPASVIEIGKYSFRNCVSLTSIVIPDMVKKIGMYSFCDCTGLTSIIIPDSVTEIGEKSLLWLLKSDQYRHPQLGEEIWR